jgi:hypothetical protein
MSRKKTPADTCKSCGREGGKHLFSCAANRCHRDGCWAPALVNGFCSPCWRAIQKERKAIVKERLERLDGP